MRQGAVWRAYLETSIDGNFDQVWYLISDIDAWPGLMPHVHAVQVLASRDDRSLIRAEARRGWLPLTLVSGVEGRRRNEGRGKREERGGAGVFHRWYVDGPWRGIIETWRAEDIGDRVHVHVHIAAPGWAARLAARFVILPLARRTLEMVTLLGEAHWRVHR